MLLTVQGVGEDNCNGSGSKRLLHHAGLGF